MRDLKISALVVCCGCVVSGAQAQTEYYRQDPQGMTGGFSSQDARNPGGLGWFSEAADDFPGQSGWNVNNVKFWGGYGTTIEQVGHTHGFTVRFYSDNAGRPGARLFEQDVAAFHETVYYTNPGNNSVGLSYSCDLSPSFTVPSTGTYWVSVVAILDRGGSPPVDEPQWGWVYGASPVQGNPGQQWFFSPGNFNPTGIDYPFVLSNIPVGNACYANCDASTANPVLNANDFQCFLNAYAAASTLTNTEQIASYANCDHSTGNPALNANDFQCFLNAYAVGCT